MFTNTSQYTVCAHRLNTVFTIERIFRFATVGTAVSRVSESDANIVGTRVAVDVWMREEDSWSVDGFRVEMQGVTVFGRS